MLDDRTVLCAKHRLRFVSLVLPDLEVLDGDRGMLLSDYGKHLLLPEQEFADFQRPAPFIPPSKGHWAEWIHACKTGDPTTCNFEYAGCLTEANHLGNLAFRLGKKLEWDNIKGEVTNVNNPKEIVSKEYRKGWELPC